MRIRSGGQGTTISFVKFFLLICIILFNIDRICDIYATLILVAHSFVTSDHIFVSYCNIRTIRLTKSYRFKRGTPILWRVIRWGLGLHLWIQNKKLLSTTTPVLGKRQLGLPTTEKKRKNLCQPCGQLTFGNVSYLCNNTSELLTSIRVLKIVT